MRWVIDMLIKNQKIIISILLAAFILRIIPIIFLEIKSPGYHEKNVNEVEFYYDDVARSVIAGKGFVHSVNPRSFDSPYNFKPGTPFHFVPPLYAWWLSLLYFIFGPNILLAKIFQAFMDASVCLLVYRISQKVNDSEFTSQCSSFLYAVYPLAVYMSVTLYYQVPLNLALCWIVLCLMRDTNLKNGTMTGVATGISALAKPITLPLIAMLPLVKLTESKSHIKSVFVWTMGFTLACFIVLTPWTIRNFIVFKRFIPVQSGAGSPLIQGSKEDYIDLDVFTLRERYGSDFGLKESDFTKAAVKNHFEHLCNNPLDYFRFLAKKFGLTWYNTEGKSKNGYALAMQLPFLVLALIGLSSNLKFWMKSPNWYVIGMIMYICLIQVVFFPLLRYTLAVMPLVMILSAFGIEYLLSFSLFPEKISNYRK